jgi:uncharacterized protein (DUF4213/DUF364 family)
LSQIAFEDKPWKYAFSDTDVLDLIYPKDKVVMVGYFGPLIPKIFKKTEEIFVLEKKKVYDSRVKLASKNETPKILSSSDIILISGSTLINKTLDQILKHTANAREVVLLGPTASIPPQPFFKRGVTAVMGVKVTDPEKMLKVISEAGGTRQLLSTCAKKTAIIKEKSAL